jgi:four helix bundle protein
LYVALGSCAELSTQLTIARRLGYIADGEGMALLDELDQVSRMTMSLIKKLS